MVDIWNPERRRNERREVPFPLYAHVVDVTADGAASSQPLDVRVSGVSVGGLVLESTSLLPVDHRLSLTLIAPGGEIGPLEGRVVHSRLVLPPHVEAAPSYISGLAFDSPPPAASAAIEALLFSISRHSAPDSARQVP